MINPHPYFSIIRLNNQKCENLPEFLQIFKSLYSFIFPSEMYKNMIIRSNVTNIQLNVFGLQTHSAQGTRKLN